MSYYYKYDFMSPESVYATVKEELKSYFDTGAVDDLMFPTYLSKCLRKLSRATLPIDEAPLYIDDYQARLPDNFYAAREVWMCAQVSTTPYQDANSFYTQSGLSVVQVSPMVVGGNVCNGNCDSTECPKCSLDTTLAVYKTNETTSRVYQRLFLLKPGNISARSNCSVDYKKGWATYGQTPGASSYDSFDIRDNKLITNFRYGTIHMVFYSEKVDKDFNQLIPDNFRIQEYVEHFIKYKVFEILANQTNDETFKQIQEKVLYYKQLADEAFIMADIEVKKETIGKKMQKIKKDLRRNNKYERMTPNYNSFFNRNN